MLFISLGGGLAKATLGILRMAGLAAFHAAALELLPDDAPACIRTIGCTKQDVRRLSADVFYAAVHRYREQLEAQRAVFRHQEMGLRQPPSWHAMPVAARRHAMTTYYTLRTTPEKDRIVIAALEELEAYYQRGGAPREALCESLTARGFTPAGILTWFHGLSRFKLAACDVPGVLPDTFKARFAEELWQLSVAEVARNLAHVEHALALIEDMERSARKARDV